MNPNGASAVARVNAALHFFRQTFGEKSQSLPEKEKFGDKLVTLYALVVVWVVLGYGRLMELQYRKLYAVVFKLPVL